MTKCLHETGLVVSEDVMVVYVSACCVLLYMYNLRYVLQNCVTNYTNLAFKWECVVLECLVEQVVTTMERYYIDL